MGEADQIPWWTRLHCTHALILSFLSLIASFVICNRHFSRKCWTAMASARWAATATTTLAPRKIYPAFANCSNRKVCSLLRSFADRELFEQRPARTENR